MNHLQNTLRTLVLALALLVGLAGSSEAQTPSSNEGAGRFALLHDAEYVAQFGTFGTLDTEQLFEFGLELRLSGTELFHGVTLQPIAGATLLADGGNHFYLGARAEIPTPIDRLRVGLSFAPGVYSEESVDLGGPLEFRSGFDLTYELFDSTRAGIGIFHLSNGGLYSLNGGSESALFSLSTKL